MRPVDRGDVPQIVGKDKSVSNYKDWRQDLLDRIGNYCSYCNMVLNDSPQVEHVVPKNPQAGQPAGALLAWDNMLLACGPCNRAKSNHPHSATTHYFPDANNTDLIFDYIVINHPRKSNQKACVPIPKSTLNTNQKVKAQNTIDLCKLDKLTIIPSATDLRWKYRFEAWHSANLIWKNQWDNWGNKQPNDFIPLLVDAAKAKGFFSIWFEAFNDVPEAKKALIIGFIGTDPTSYQNISPFDAQPRNPTDPTDTI